MGEQNAATGQVDFVTNKLEDTALPTGCIFLYLFFVDKVTAPGCGLFAPTPPLLANASCTRKLVLREYSAQRQRVRRGHTPHRSHALATRGLREGAIRID